MKKLLFVITSLENTGGTERSLTSRVNYLVDKYEYDITIVTTTQDKNEGNFFRLDDRIRQYSIPINFGRKTFFSKMGLLFWRNYKNEKPLLDFIQENRFNICTSLGEETFLYYERHYKPFKRIKENRFTYKRMLSDEKMTMVRKFWRYLLFKKNIAIQNRMDCVITLTEEDATFLRKHIIKKIYVMPNFIDLSKCRSSRLNSNVLIAVGRLEKEKDYKSLILAFKKVNRVHSDWCLHIYGEGSLRNDIQLLIDKNMLSNSVTLKGSVNNIYDQYLEASICVHTAFYEGFSNALLEAVSHGLPIVAFESVGGIKVLLKDKYNGLLVKNRNIDDLSNAIIQLIENPAKRKEFGSNSQEISKDYDIKTIMEKWHHFYSRISDEIS